MPIGRVAAVAGSLASLQSGVQNERQHSQIRRRHIATRQVALPNCTPEKSLPSPIVLFRFDHHLAPAEELVLVATNLSCMYPSDAPTCSQCRIWMGIVLYSYDTMQLFDYYGRPM